MTKETSVQTIRFQMLPELENHTTISQTIFRLFLKILAMTRNEINNFLHKFPETTIIGFHKLNIQILLIVSVFSNVYISPKLSHLISEISN